MRSIVCLISGRGSNLEALLHAERAQRWSERYHARIAAVVSNRASARGLDVARTFGVDAQIVDDAPAAAGASFDDRLGHIVHGYSPALVVLAGFMRVLGAGFVDRLAGRMINVHPSLLPAFPGLATHRRALESGARLHGATVHFVSPVVDAGAIIAQSVVRTLPDDSEAVLARRVLAAEHRLLPRCVAWYLGGHVRLVDGRALVDGVDPSELLELPGAN